LNVQETYEYTRLSGESWAEGFTPDPRILNMPPRKVGEAISYGHNGKALYLVSEEISQPL